MHEYFDLLVVLVDFSHELSYLQIIKLNNVLS